MWTMDNTEGFTQQQLDMINNAIKIVIAKRPDIERSNVNDAINNAWVEQDTAEALASAALERL